jgi:hypothetical protein
VKRFWILFTTEVKAWRHDPVSAAGGFIPTIFILLAFGLLFGGRLAFKLGVINHDRGEYGARLSATLGDVLSPFGTPYYEVIEMPEEQTWQAYRDFRLEGVWVIPADFSARLQAGENPRVAMYFSNYNDDRAKNHRIYAAEILWRFYEDIRGELNLPSPPLGLAETYPLPEMIEWFPVIGVGVVLLGFMIGGMMNIFMLTYKEQVNQLTLEFGLAPRPLGWILLPKTLLALMISLLTGTTLMGVLYIWVGAWPHGYLWAVWLLAALVTLFWTPITMAFGLRAEYFAGAITVMLTALTSFFIGGGLSLVRVNRDRATWFTWLIPNAYAVDPLRDLILFQQWPADWRLTLLILSGFALLGLVSGWGLTWRQLRRLG